MSRQDVIRAAHRAQFRERQQHNRIVGQLNSLRNQGFTAEDIRAAGNNAWAVLGGQGSGSYTVKDGDTLSTIASASGTTPTDLLNANPDVKQVKTGMVINTPGSEAWRVQNAYGPGGVGLPSNAALGGTTTNPQGMNPAFRPIGGEQSMRTPGYLENIQTQRQNQQRAVGNLFNQNNPYPGIANAGQPRQYPLYANNTVGPTQPRYPGYGNVNNNPQGPYPLYAGNNVAPRNPYPLYAASVMSAQAAQAQIPTTPTATPQTVANDTATKATGPKRSFAPRGNFGTFINSITAQVGPSGRLPTEFELQYLIEHGRVKAPQTATGGYGGGYGGWGRRRGGGGGGGGRRGGRGGGGKIGQERLPAFSTGAGFGSLVNWRI